MSMSWRRYLCQAMALLSLFCGIGVIRFSYFMLSLSTDEWDEKFERTYRSPDIVVVPPPEHSSRKNVALAILANQGDTGNLHELDVSLNRFATGYDEIFVFHDGGLNESIFDRNSALHSATFFQLDHEEFHKLPNNFETEGLSNMTRKGKTLYKNHVNRFWFDDVFTLEILHNFSWIARLDPESCLKKPYNFSGQLDGDVAYIPNEQMLDEPKYAEELYEKTMQYISKYGIPIRNPSMWMEIFKNHARRGFDNTFEITNTTFFRSFKVRHFVNYIVNMEPYGIYKYRWGDTLLRYIALALFSDAKHKILWENEGKDAQCHPCGRCPKENETTAF